ncbi:hypothetical protein C5B73_00550 (plasmid) [Nocardia cyriacigeorgica]|nr:hypothetical protein C5B73_00550 [Nocardia cyriacigeorgica]
MGGTTPLGPPPRRRRPPHGGKARGVRTPPQTGRHPRLPSVSFYAAAFPRLQRGDSYEGSSVRGRPRVRGSGQCSPSIASAASGSARSQRTQARRYSVNPRPRARRSFFASSYSSFSGRQVRCGALCGSLGVIAPSSLSGYPFVQPLC